MRITVLLLLVVPLLAESIAPFPARRVVSPAGTHVLEVRASKNMASLEYRLSKREGALIKAGKLDYLPAEFIVLDDAPAVLLLDTYGEAGRKTTLALLKSDGSIAWRLELKDLFEDREKFLETMSQTIWQRAWWVDEEDGRVVLVARGGAAVEVAIESGKASRLKRERAVELAEQAALRQDPGGDQAVPALVELGGTRALVGLIGHEETPKARRAAIDAALAAAGDSTLIDELAREFQDSEIDTAERLLEIGARVDPDRLHRALVDYETTLLKLLTRGSPQIGWLSDHFAMVPTSQAVKPLLKALKTHQHDAKLAPRIIAALKPCTGRDFGPGSGAWLKAYKVR